jgi:cytochrome c peroxidase
MQCHYGPRLTDDAFHATRSPTGRQDAQPDQGRAAGVPQLLASEFRADGAFSDAPSAAHGLAGLAVDPAMTGAFKTPALRGVAGSAPYGHGGVLATLDDVVKLYSSGGLPTSDARAAGVAPPWLVQFDPSAASLTPFLQTLTADPSP